MERCSYKDRRIVYLLIGYPNSGVSAVGKTLCSRHTETGQKCAYLEENLYYRVKGAVSCTELDRSLAMGTIKSGFLEHLADTQIRRIFVDANLLDPENRRFFVGACVAAEIEYHPIMVGNLADVVHIRNAQVTNPYGLDVEFYSKLIRHWKNWYTDVRNEAMTIESQTGSKARILRDNRIATIKDYGNVSRIQIDAKADGSYSRQFEFTSNKDAENEFLTIESGAYLAPKELARMRVGNYFNGSFVPATFNSEA